VNATGPGAGAVPATAADAATSLSLVLTEICDVAERFDHGQVQVFVAELLGASRIYVAGQGRSGLAGQGLAQRLMHNGLSTYIVGDVVVPAVAPGDVCIAVTASGKTATTLHQAGRAKDAGARLVAVTQPGQSPLLELSDAALLIPSSPPSGLPTQQYATTLFCQFAQLLFDSVCRLVLQKLGQHDSDLRRRHTNFE
jgi:6-phospho-3-hexuloisomerase